MLFVPAALACAFPVGILYLSGELTPDERVIEEQLESKALVLFGPAYRDFKGNFKLRSVVRRMPDVLVLGTSRVLQFRAQLFANPAAFYNAGLGVVHLRHFRQFLEMLPPERAPSLLIIGLDQKFFAASERDIAIELYGTEAPSWVMANKWATVSLDYMRGKYRLSDAWSDSEDAPRIGLAARVDGKGVRNDGSYRYGDYLRNPDVRNHTDRDFEASLYWISRGSGGFPWGPGIGQAALDEVAQLLESCRNRRIRVVAFLPPFAHAVYERQASMPQFRYVLEIERDLRPIFERFEGELFDFSDLASVGASDVETVDGSHGSEAAYVRLFLRMLEHSVILPSFAADSRYLRRRLAEAGSRYEVFKTLQP